MRAELVAHGLKHCALLFAWELALCELAVALSYAARLARVLQLLYHRCVFFDPLFLLFRGHGFVQLVELPQAALVDFAARKLQIY